MKNDLLMDIANEFMNDCDDFEIKNLSANSDEKIGEKSLEIELCSDYINRRILGFDEQFERHIVATGNETLDKIGILEKGWFKLFYTNNMDFKVQRIVNNVVLEAVNNGKKVLKLSTYLSFACSKSVCS